MSRIILAKFLFTIFYLVCSLNASASTFGETCSLLPVSGNGITYLEDDTIYGLIKNHIDVKTHTPNSCEDTSEDFNFCIKNLSGNPAICDVVSLSVNQTRALGSLAPNSELAANVFLSNVEISAKLFQNTLCITMPTSRGEMPLICRNYEAEPVITPITNASVAAICERLGGSCYEGRTKTQSLLGFSGLTIHCLRDTLDRIFYVGNECPVPEDENRAISFLKPFPEFQEIMKNSVRAALVIYVILYGFQLALDPQKAELNEIAIFILKFIFVLYFAVGIGQTTNLYGHNVQENGMTSVALPFLVEMTSKLAEIVFDASGSGGLCNFDVSRYEPGYEFYKLWDAIDCRMGYYLGMKILYNVDPILDTIIGSLGYQQGDPITWEIPGVVEVETLGKSGVFSIFTVIFGFFIGGQVIIFLLLIVMVISLISFCFYFLTLYLVCTVTLYVMAYISPIFVPMILFEKTKTYFDSWLRILISVALQPAIVGTFIALILTIYDYSMYGNCEFSRRDYEFNEFKFSTFELRLPDIDQENCYLSAGYLLMNLYLGNQWVTNVLILFPIVTITMSAVLTFALVKVIVFFLIFYFFMKSVNEFASDITGGPSASGVTVSPNMLTDKAIGIAKAAYHIAKAVVKGKTGDVQGAAKDASAAKDELTKDTSENKDNSSSGGGDEISRGGSVGKDQGSNNPVSGNLDGGGK